MKAYLSEQEVQAVTGHHVMLIKHSVYFLWIQSHVWKASRHKIMYSYVQQRQNAGNSERGATGMSGDAEGILKGQCGTAKGKICMGKQDSLSTCHRTGGHKPPWEPGSQADPQYQLAGISKGFPRAEEVCHRARMPPLPPPSPTLPRLLRRVLLGGGLS